MHRNTKLVALAAVLFATAWGKPQGTYNFEVDGSLPANGTAIIRPALKEEKRFQTSTAKKIFFGGGAWLEMRVVSKGYDVPGAADVHKYAAVRVRPGKYLVVLTCNTTQFVTRFDLQVDAEAGGEYLLECQGAGHGTRAHVWRKDQPVVGETAMVTSAGVENDGVQTPAPASTWVAPWQW